MGSAGLEGRVQPSRIADQTPPTVNWDDRRQRAQQNLLDSGSRYSRDWAVIRVVVRATFHWQHRSQQRTRAIIRLQTSIRRWLVKETLWEARRLHTAKLVLQSHARGFLSRQATKLRQPVVSSAVLATDFRMCGTTPLMIDIATLKGPAVQLQPTDGKLEHVVRTYGMDDPSLRDHFNYSCRPEVAQPSGGVELGSAYMAGDSEIRMVTQCGEGPEPADSAWRAAGVTDDPKQRASWFVACLHQIAGAVPSGATLVFPHGSEWFSDKADKVDPACELWELQRTALIEFAREQRQLRIVVVQRSHDVYKQAMLKRKRQILAEAKVMTEQLADAPDETKRIGRLLVQCLAGQQLESIPERIDTRDTTPVADACAAVADSAAQESAQEAAYEKIREGNQAVDDAFRDTLRADLKEDKTTLEEIAYTRWTAVAMRGEQAAPRKETTAHTASLQESSQLVGTRVVVQGLELVDNRVFNGYQGYISGPMKADGRVPVTLDKSQEHGTVQLRFDVSEEGTVSLDAATRHTLGEEHVDSHIGRTINAKLHRLRRAASESEGEPACL